MTQTLRISPIYILCIGLPLHSARRVSLPRDSGMSDWDTSLRHSIISQASEKAGEPLGVTIGVSPLSLILSVSLPEWLPQYFSASR